MRLIASRSSITNQTRITIFATVLLLLLIPAAAHGDYALTWSSVTNGGGRSTGEGYVLIGGIGCSCRADLQMADTDVRFSLRDQGNGQIQIGYSTINGDAPRSIALNVNLDGTSVHSPSDVVTTDSAFNGFLDYIYTNPAGYVLGAGHPLANPSGPGVPSFGAGLSQFAVNMACFDETGSQAPGPVSSMNLITLQLHGSGPATVTIDADTTRACSFAEQGQTVNLPLHFNVTLP
jgi:hypothetical protein